MPRTSPTFVFRRLLGRKVLGLLFLATCCAGAYWFVNENSVAEPKAKLFVPPAALQFGEVFETNAFSWSLPVENRSSQVLNIIGFSNSCSCVSVEPNSLVLEPGGSATIKLTLDLTAGPSGAEPVREFQAVVLPRFDGMLRSQDGWRITGTIRKAFSMQPPGEFVAQDIIRGTKYLLQEIRGTVHIPLYSIKASCNIANVYLRPGLYTKDFVVQFQFHEWLPVGYHRTELILEPLAKNGEVVTRSTVPVEVHVREPVVAVPSNLSFGAHTLGSLVQDLVQLKSLTGSMFHVDRIQSSSDSIVIERTGATADSTAGNTYRIKVRVKDVRDQKEQIVFFINTNERRIEVPLAIHYFGVDRAP